MDKRRNSDLILLAYRLQEIQKTGGKTTIRHDDDSGKHDFIKYTPTPGSPYLGVQRMLGYVGWKADVTDLIGKAIGYITINADPLTRN